MPLADTAEEQIRDAQKESWDKFSPGWKKWDAQTMEFLRPFGEEIIARVSPKEGDHVLDIAAGTGEPGLTLAQKIGSGKIVLTDLSEGMLEVASEKAQTKGLKNVETRILDASEIPYEDNTFDIVSCRMGFMFFPNMQLAASEMARVLKPGGRISTSVWSSPENNFWVTATMGTIKKYVDVPHPPPGAPGMFRCAEPGMLKSIFEGVGLKKVTESEVGGNFALANAEEYWSMMTEVGAPIVGALSKTDEATREKIRKEVIALIDEKFPENTAIPCHGLVISGEK